MSDKKCGIYKITNTLTNEAYIGQSKNIEKRIATHKEDLENGTHVNKGLQEDYDLAKSLDPDYEIFSFEIIKEVKAKDLNKEEMYWINEFNTFERGYNKTSGGSHDETKGHVDYGGGRLFTDEKRIKLMTKELTDDFANKENYIFKTTSNEVICSKCGKEFNNEFDFCPFCGTKKPQPKICPKCKLEPSIEFSFCPKCGTELLEKEEYLEQIEKKKMIKEYKRFNSEQKKLEKEWKKGQEICDLKEKDCDYPFEELFELYNEIIRIYNSIDEEIYNSKSPFDDYIFKEYDLDYLKEQILEVKDYLKIIKKIYEYEEILENKEWTFTNTELYEIITDYYKLIAKFEDMYGAHSEDQLKKWYGILDKATTIFPDESIYWREKGFVLYNQNKNEQAIESYKKALKRNPKDKETYVRLFYILTLKNPNEALKYCNNALEEYPLDKTFIREKLEILDEIHCSPRNLSVDEKKLHEIEKLECYAKLLILGENISEKFGIEENEEILNLAANEMLKIEKYEESLKIYDKLISLNPNNSLNFINKAECLKIIGKSDEVLQCYDKIIELEPYNGSFLGIKANYLFDMKRYEESMKYYNQILENKSSDTFYFKIGDMTPYEISKIRCLEGLERYEEGIEYCDELIESNKEDYVVISWKGRLLEDLLRYVEAKKCYEEIIKILDKLIELQSPNDIENITIGYYENKSTYLKVLKRYEEAEETLEKALNFYDKASEKDPYFNYYKICILQDLEKHQEAIEICDELIEIEKNKEPLIFRDEILPNSFEIDYLLLKAYSLKTLEKWEEALKCYDQMIQIEPRLSIHHIDKKKCLKKLEE